MMTPILLFLSRYGSVYVDYEIVGAVIDDRFKKDVATIISRMFNGDINLIISNHGQVNVIQVTIKDENGNKTACEYILRFKQFSLKMNV